MARSSTGKGGGKGTARGAPPRKSVVGKSVVGKSVVDKSEVGKSEVGKSGTGKPGKRVSSVALVPKAAAKKKKPARNATAGKAAVKKAAVKKTPAKAGIAAPVAAAMPKPARAAAARVKASPLPPLPPPLPAPPKKLSRSPVRRAVGRSTGVQRHQAATETFSEGELREKMRLAAAYIESWLSRRTVFAAEVTAPEDAWAQVWLWLKRAASLDDGRVLTEELFEALYADEMTKSR